MVTVLRVLFAPALLSAGAALFLCASMPSAWAGDLDAPMQPIARGAAVPASVKHKATLPGDATQDPPALGTLDRTSPEYSGDAGLHGDDPTNALVDRTAGTLDSVSTATSNILRLERP
jgi:hypothetical protein